MASRRKIPSETQDQIRQRANYLCEYCHTSEAWQYVRFTIEHVIPLAQGGTDTIENLALACFHCNRRKSDKLMAVEPETGEMVSLFNPRQHNWHEHFIWSTDGLFILPLTPVGQVTITLLELNRERVVQIRLADVTVGRHPPTGDLVQKEDK